MIREAAATLIDARRGDVQAFNRLVEACQEDAYSLAFRLLGEEQVAVGALHKAVELAYGSLKSCRGEFRLWFFHYIVDECRSAVRSHTGLPVVPQDHTDIQSLLNTLPLDLRLSAVLVDVLGLNYDQAAEVAGVRNKKIRQSLAMARYSLT